MIQAYRVTRKVSTEECDWLLDDIDEGSILYQCVKPTYGCCSTGEACTFSSEGDYPFFELPCNALQKIELNERLRA